MRAYDEFGNEVFPVVIQTIAPIEHAAEAREISHEFLLQYGGTDSVESMLPVLLRPVGGIPTHIYCSRDGYTHELANQLAFLATREESWISGELETDAGIIFTHFCTFTGDLESLGLEVA